MTSFWVFLEFFDFLEPIFMGWFWAKLILKALNWLFNISWTTSNCPSCQNFMKRLWKVLNNVARHERKSFSFSTIFVLLWFRFSFLLLQRCFEDSRELGSSVVFFREKTATDALSWDSTEKPDPHSLSHFKPYWRFSSNQAPGYHRKTTPSITHCTL